LLLYEKAASLNEYLFSPATTRIYSRSTP